MSTIPTSIPVAMSSPLERAASTTSVVVVVVLVPVSAGDTVFAVVFAGNNPYEWFRCINNQPARKVRIKR